MNIQLFKAIATVQAFRFDPYLKERLDFIESDQKISNWYKLEHLARNGCKKICLGDSGTSLAEIQHYLHDDVVFYRLEKNESSQVLLCFYKAPEENLTPIVKYFRMEKNFVNETQYRLQTLKKFRSDLSGKSPRFYIHFAIRVKIASGDQDTYFGFLKNRGIDPRGFWIEINKTNEHCETLDIFVDEHDQKPIYQMPRNELNKSYEKDIALENSLSEFLKKWREENQAAKPISIIHKMEFLKDDELLSQWNELKNLSSNHCLMICIGDDPTYLFDIKKYLISGSVFYRQEKDVSGQVFLRFYRTAQDNLIPLKSYVRFGNRFIEIDQLRLQILKKFRIEGQGKSQRVFISYKDKLNVVSGDENTDFRFLKKYRINLKHFWIEINKQAGQPETLDIFENEQDAIPLCQMFRNEILKKYQTRKLHKKELIEARPQVIEKSVQRKQRTLKKENKLKEHQERIQKIKSNFKNKVPENSDQLYDLLEAKVSQRSNEISPFASSHKLELFTAGKIEKTGRLPAMKHELTRFSPILQYHNQPIPPINLQPFFKFLESDHFYYEISENEEGEWIMNVYRNLEDRDSKVLFSYHPSYTAQWIEI